MMHDDCVMINLQALDINKKTHSIQNQPKSANPADAQQTGPDSALNSLLATLPSLGQALHSKEPLQQMMAVQKVRQILSYEGQVSSVISEVINAGVVPCLIEMLQRNDAQELQFEAAWALTNIASDSSEHTTWLVGQGVVPIFVGLLGSSSASVTEQAVWGLSNIAGDSTHMRDVVLSSQGAFQSIIQLLNTPSLSSSLRENLAWALSNLLRGTPHPPQHFVEAAIPTLRALIDVDTTASGSGMVDALWALSYCTDGENDRIEVVVRAGVIPQLVFHLSSPDENVLLPALRCIGHIATGSEQQTAALLTTNLLQQLTQLVAAPHVPGKEPPSDTILKECCWTLSNISAGTTAQIQQLISSGVFPHVVSLTASSTLKVRKEALWCICNVLSGGTEEHVRYLIEELGSLSVLAKVIDPAQEPELLVVALDGVQIVLNNGETFKALHSLNVNPYHAMLNNTGVAAAIQAVAATPSASAARDVAQGILAMASS
eukprot:CAMPEP_0181324108 /NCGR_PEP_ID=MMETSP1101-20121128/20170_1 /TAXON_ID=46948 /ORGANISM="Rhodomonas abbreviata, Strain Caron Lab Isolate" /LENGTH=488 /DNA_ID=CAMNT_0023432235 /DNA_START=100 /DNA_END=1566 /DNA_ORIENTATION=-